MNEGLATAGDEGTTDTQEAVLPRPQRVRAAVLAFAAVAATATVGSGLFMRTPPGMILGPIAGIIVALAVSSPLDAALLGAAGGAAGFALARLAALPKPDPLPDLMPGLLVAALVAGLVGAAARFALGASPRLGRIFKAAGICLVVGGVWLSVTTLSGAPAPDGSTFVGLMSTVPELARFTPDEGLYLTYIARLHEGQDYYRIVGDTLSGANRARIGPVDLSTPLSFRLPTLYVALSWLPPGGMWLILASLVCATAALLAAYALARRFVAPPFALVGAAAAASFYAGQSLNVSLLDAEMWAGVLGLVVVTLLVYAYSGSSRRSALVWAAAATALAGALIRELALPFLVVGLAASLLTREGRARREWLPWVLAFAATIAAYAAHFAAARRVIGTLASDKALSPSWIHPDGLGFVAAVSRVSGIAHMTLPVVWGITAIALLGVLIGTRGMPRFVLALAAFGGCAVLLVMYPTGYSADGLPPGYWGDVVFGIVLACLPLAFARLAPAEVTDTGTETDASS